MFNLLSTGNTKTLKGLKKGYNTYILHLSPYNLAGFGNVCSHASQACKTACLNSAGRGGMFKKGESLENNTHRVQIARKRKTALFFNNVQNFMELLVADIEKAIKQSNKKGLTPVFRLNGTSDIAWHKIKIITHGNKNIFELFPTVQFYDYTKNPAIAIASQLIDNYHITFSQSENNHETVKTMLQSGVNVAIVFNKLPEHYYNKIVHDGDNTDLRFLDKPGIIGLKAKGKAKKDNSGFVVKIA
jgi:hypothetical protein